MPDEGAHRDELPPAVRLGGLVVGLGLFAAVMLSPPPAGIAVAAWRVAAVAALMAVWWMTEAIPIPATAMAPLALFPLLGIGTIEETAAPYANPLIFLFLGGFVIALAMQRWNLHRRVALAVLARVGTRPDAIVAGFMGVTGAMSMWVSNTASTVMMLPIALSVIGVIENGRGAGAAPKRGFAQALLLATAYGASIGGIATLVGTPPNALLAGYMAQTYKVTIGFAQWMAIGLPLAAVLMAFAWLLLTRVLFRIGHARLPQAAQVIADERASLGPWSRGERVVALVFVATALAWVLRPLIAKAVPGLGLTDPQIAVAAAVALFVIPIDARRGVFAIDWGWAVRLPWGVLILFGGGLTLASAIVRSGLAEWIGAAMAGFGHWPTLGVLLLVTAVIVFLTELTSNTATAAAFLPVVTTLAVAVGENPLLLAVPAIIGASCAFMMPVATPPNAIVFASGHLTVPDMARAGFLVNLTAILLIVAAAYVLLGPVFDAVPGVMPAWAK